MYEQVEKTKENKSRVVANSVKQKKSNGVQGSGFVNNRPKAIEQRMLQKGTKCSQRDHCKESVAQLLKIGKIPNDAWRSANVPSHAQYTALAAASTIQHDTADFKNLDEILAANAKHFSTAPRIANPAPAPGHTLASDYSAKELRRTQEFTGQIANIDHIVDYNYWGSNDFRNARVVSANENNPGPISRPGNNIDLISNETKTINGAALTANNTIPISDINLLLSEADNLATSTYVPDNDGATKKVAAAHNLTDNDMWALYKNLP